MIGVAIQLSASVQGLFLMPELILNLQNSEGLEIEPLGTELQFKPGVDFTE